MKERPDDRAPTLDEDRSNPALREPIQQPREIHFVLPAPQHLRVREHPLGSIGGHDHRGRASIEHVRAHGRLPMRVEYDPERISTFCKLGLDGEFRIVRQDGPDSHENRIDL